MIQLYLLILIVVFVIIFYFNKESFQSDAPVFKGDLQCDQDKQRVALWDGDGVYLYGCNSLYNDDTSNLSQISIKLFWNKNDINDSKTIIIVNTEDDDDTFIKDISDEKVELDENENTNVPQPIKTYELKHNIIEGKTYFITVNYVKDDIIYVSNTLQITAVSPVPHFKSSGFKIQQQNLMNLLRNKTFDIYL
jgi:hypothetical protein